jgi:cation diffusion facilitator CzcD-associated flavoprotein CzcO
VTATDVDVLIVGAGLSGIGAACHLTRECPEHSFTILERRQAIGGTWDLFRYPGVRSDSDMHTFGYAFRPWPRSTVLSDGASIRRYIHETAAEYGVDRRIRFGHRVERASWSTDEARWTVEAVDEASGQRVHLTANFLMGCSGYYSYDQAYTPDLPGLDRFAGEIIHPQFWPDDFDHAGKRVLVVGSGATAVTLVPELAKTADHVHWLQRSPGYIVTLPESDLTVTALRRVLPDELVANITRKRNAVLQFALYRLCQRFPRVMRRLILAGVRRQIGPDVEMRHFSPSYNPWDERLCVVPNGDLFTALRSGDATVTTDHIQTFTEHGVRTASGDELDADVVVTATGLQVQLFGGITLEVDGHTVDPTQRLTYKGAMLSDVPNLAFVFGYVNVSWTRKADLVCEYVTRVLNHMDHLGVRQVTPRGGEPFASDEPFIEMTAGYIERARHLFPEQGTEPPWRNRQNVIRDTAMLRHAPVADRFLEFSNRQPAAATAA